MNYWIIGLIKTFILILICYNLHTIFENGIKYELTKRRMCSAFYCSTFNTYKTTICLVYTMKKNERLDETRHQEPQTDAIRTQQRESLAKRDPCKSYHRRDNNSQMLMRRWHQYDRMLIGLKHDMIRRS